MKKKAAVVCDICGAKGVRRRRISRTYGKGKTLFVMENIPATICPACGESYITAETLHEIERLKLHRKSLAVGRRIDVVTFT